LGIEKNKRKYEVTKKAAKRGIVEAQKEEQEKFGERLDEEDRKGTVFRLAKQRCGEHTTKICQMKSFPGMWKLFRLLMR